YSLFLATTTPAVLAVQMCTYSRCVWGVRLGSAEFGFATIPLPQGGWLVARSEAGCPRHRVGVVQDVPVARFDMPPPAVVCFAVGLLKRRHWEHGCRAIVDIVAAEIL